MLSCVLLLAACGGEPGTPQSATAAPEAEPEERTNGKLSGEGAYERYCIACHETGLLDAPVVGDAREWAEVSKLWQAVVVEHMLAITYPELPLDIR